MSELYYDPKNHISNLIDSPYYRSLTLLRNQISLACDSFFQNHQAPKIDLFMIARGVSSPMGKGSDSEPIPMKLGEQHVYLVDSAQFGMEPLVMKHFEMVYCYLPSFRGEDSDDRHLSQFYHCEAELAGTYEDTMKVVESLVKHIFAEIIKLESSTSLEFEKHNLRTAAAVVDHTFPVISFEDAVTLLNKVDSTGKYIEKREYGRVITNAGEKYLSTQIGGETPIWLTKYDRDTVPFYQKPDPSDPSKALNADLIFPAVNGSFGGEIVGSGQRQDNVDEIAESITRQGIKDSSAYDWYINLRKNPSYRTTAGFGLGIERLIAWLLGLEAISDAAIYPVQKNVPVDY